MLNLRNNILYALVFCNLYGIVRPNEKLSQQEKSCVLTDAPNQCGAFCLAAQRPLFDHNQNVQKQLNLLADLLREIKANMDRIESETKAYLANLGTTQRESLAILSSLKKGKEVEPNSIQGTKRIPRGFQKIGTRYFLISNTSKRCFEADIFCHEKGGHLAVFQNEEGVDAIQPKVRKDRHYWLDIQASGKEHFLNGSRRHRYFNFMGMVNGEIDKYSCMLSKYPICELDNEV